MFKKSKSYESLAQMAEHEGDHEMAKEFRSKAEVERQKEKALNMSLAQIKKMNMENQLKRMYEHDDWSEGEIDQGSGN